MIGNFSSSLPATVRSIGIKQLFGATLVAAAAAAVPAHASVITFEGYAGPVAGTEVWNEAGYSVGFYANVADGGVDTLVGQFIDGDESTCDTSSMVCPANVSGTYYAALNDSYLDIVYNGVPRFQLQSFDAGFIGSNTSLSSYPSTPALVRLQGFLSNGTYLTQDFALTGATPNGFNFGHFQTTGAFANALFVEVLAFGLVCNNAGSCSGFNSDRAQFAIDNITTNEVPEPASAAIVGLGLLALGAARRRKS